MMRRGLIDIPVRRLARWFGFDVERKRPVLAELLEELEVGTVLDVGANTGQYARRLRAWGYRGRIVSFEPLRSALVELERNAVKDPLWEVRDFALGEEDGPATMHVSEASVFSSMRQVRPELKAAFASAAPVGTETVAVRRLDSVFESLQLGSEAVFLKIDTQGYEREVIRGATRSLDSIAGVQLEVSLRTLYEGETALPEMMRLMEDHSFQVVAVEPVVYDAASKALLQIDCVFFRSRAVGGSSPLEDDHSQRA